MFLTSFKVTFLIFSSSINAISADVITIVIRGILNDQRFISVKMTRPRQCTKWWRTQEELNNLLKETNGCLWLLSMLSHQET